MYDTIRPHRYPFTFLIFAPIIIAPDWFNLFGVMCDARDFAIGVMLGQMTKFSTLFIMQKEHPMKLNSTRPPPKRFVSCDICLSQSLDRT
jgi:hypothetical protein